MPMHGHEEIVTTYNGIQGPFCNEPAGTVWMWPVEYNAYGPANTRIVLRMNGAKDYAIADHLGSVRLLLGDNGMIKEQRSYGPFGEDLISDGNGARTSYIGREQDTESNLGFFGVRLYDPTYGRFMSADPLWGKYGNVSPFHYGFNNPINLVDASGLDSAGWAGIQKGVDFVVGGVAASAGVYAMFAGGALCLLPTGVSQVAGVALMSIGAGAAAFGTAKSIDAIAALANDTPTHDIPSSYGDLAGTEIDKSLGGDGTIGGMAGSLVEGLGAAAIVKAGAKATTNAAVQLLPVVEAGMSSASSGATMIELGSKVAKEPLKVQASDPARVVSGGSGGTGGLPAAVKREVD